MKHGRRFLIGALVAVGLAAALILLAAGQQGAQAQGIIIYVDASATGLGDGTAWVHAFNWLDEALDAAASGDQIWVAEGTYKPTVEHGGTGSRYRSFQMVNDVAIYGGFDPDKGDTEWADRDWVNNVTILSGDIGISGDSSDNSYHVFYHPEGTNLDRTAILDGFTITGGNANGYEWPISDGGGMYNEESSPTLSNMIFLSNHAHSQGAGMYNVFGSSPVLTNVAFSGNWATNGGGGMYNYSSSPALNGCDFEDNVATTGSGGGMWNSERSSPTLNDVTFSNNSADWHGGGVYNMGFSSPELTDCSFEGNSVAGDGGGMANYSDSAPTLTRCTFDGNSAGTQGGGMSNHVFWLEMSDCSFSGNSAENGGGMYNLGHPTLSNCMFSGNSATYSGGGMYNGWKSWAVLADCTFLGNSAQQGGGMANSGASPALTECTFSGNTALRGGGMHNDGEYDYTVSRPTLNHVTFEGNQASVTGGGIHNGEHSLAHLTGCSFEGNSAADSGGGMYNEFSGAELSGCAFTNNSAGSGGGMYNDGAWPLLTGCTFLSNSAATTGGGMHNFGLAAPTLTHCIFAGNLADTGGGMSNNEGSVPALINCTFWGNSAVTSGGGIHDELSSPPLTNCILWGNSPDQISNDASSTPAVTYSDVQGGYPGTGNIDADPLFVNAPIGDLHLGPGSPCIDVGDNTAAGLPLRDFEGDPRIMDGDGDGTAVVDMGVDEVWVPPPPVIYVDQDATGINSGLSWADAFTDLQLALDWAVAGGEIWVAEGIYKPTVEHGGSGDRFRSFQMVNGVAIYGGFDPSTGDDAWQERDWTSNVTILSGDLNGDDGSDFANNDENSYHVLFHPWELALDSSASLDGFTITGGNANLAPDDDLNNRGGGMGNFGTSPTVANCIFEGNSASHAGGGMFNSAASPVVANSNFSGNRAGNVGGGMSNWISSPIVTGCTFEGNSAGLYGGGMRNAEGSAPTVIDCAFEGNSATHRGGGIFNMWGSIPVLVNCTFWGNSSDDGGGMYNLDSSPVLTNCTFWGNAATSGGGIYNDATSAPTVTNCVLWGDSAGEIAGGSPAVTYSDVEGGYPGTGNLDADPLFLDPASGDFHLAPGSPCIDAGSNAAPSLPTYDFEGDDRVLDGDGNVLAIVDMGIDEVAITWPYFRSYLPLVLGNR